MADELSVSISFVKDHYEVTAEMVSVDVLPEEIFLYENTGTSTLGEYYGVASFAELSKQIWAGVAIPTFGNKYVRHTSALVVVPNLAEAEKSKLWIIENVKRLKAEITSAASSTQVIVI